MAELRLALPAGQYQAEWVNTRSGKVDKTEEFNHTRDEVRLVSPSYDDDVALRVVPMPT
jgi:hypothetical protein